MNRNQAQYRREAVSSRPTLAQVKNRIYPYWFLLPGLALMGVFVLAPIIWGFVISLHSFDGLNPMEWRGTSNYRVILNDPRFTSSILNTVIFALLVVVGKNVAGLAVALLFTQSLRGMSIFRTASFLPLTLNIVVIGAFWTFFLQVDRGPLNEGLRAIGLDQLAQAWLSDPQYALATVAAVEIWRWLPLHVLLYLAGLNDLSSETREAAMVDGANAYQRLLYVTIPMLRPVIFVNVLIALMGAFVRSFEMVWVLTRGGAGTNVMITNIYTEAFRFQRFGRAAAMSFVLFLITAILSFAYVKLARGGRGD